MDKKQAIFEAAAYLFARKSYEGTGIRDISSRAGVNSAMISYYYGGKKKLLIEIFKTYAALLLSVARTAVAEAETVEKFCNIAVRAITLLARENYDVFMTGMSIKKNNDPELFEINEQLNENFKQLNIDLRDKYSLNLSLDPLDLDVFGSATLSMTLSHFLLGGDLEDDEYFEKYIELITPLVTAVFNHYKN
ncbi:MAG: TetR/AcrR family transcriptional regulator [Desulfovibrio sp.]